MRSDIFHKGKYYVTFKRSFEDSKRDLTITVDKIFENDTLRVLLSDEGDPNFLCTVLISRTDYEELKKQQGLLIDFDNFPAQLVRLLQQCAANNMFLIMQTSNPAQYLFEIVEHNEFRRLVHLSLKTGPASDAEIKKHMAENITLLKSTLESVRSTLTSSEAMWNEKCISMERKIHDLSLSLTKIEEEKVRREVEYQEALRVEREKMAQEKIKYQRSSDKNMQAQLASLQETIHRKDNQIDDLNSALKHLRDSSAQLDNQIGDKNQRLGILENEVQKAHIEVATLKAKISSLERDLMDKERHISQATNRCSDLEKTIRENNDVITELRSSLLQLKKEKLSLEERLALSESLANKNNEAAYCTAEQLLKANQIIAKQNTDFVEIKEKLLCRTAIALEQEKVIERNTKEMEDLKSEIVTTRQALEKLRSDMDSLKEKYDINEKALKDKEEIIKNNNMVIDWLHRKMGDNCDSEALSRRKTGASAISSTPYFMSRNNSDNTTKQSDDTIDFYATSKVLEESPQVDTRERQRKVGLDPKYLAPAPNDNLAKNSKPNSRKVSDNEKPSSSHRGKENVLAELPRVDYREKSAKSTTHRATPVSAYFP